MQPDSVEAPASGAYADLEALIALRFPARQLRLSRRNRALASLAGASPSSFRGRGLDFDEVRAYQAGDDVRSIDWRVTARSGDAHTKLFREERERPVLVVVDQRPGMFFGSRHCFKSVLAAHLAALLAWGALENGDRVGGLVFNGAEHRELRPKRSRRNVLGLLSTIAAYNLALPGAGRSDDGSFSAMLTNLRRVVRPGSSVYLVSDFHGGDEEAGKHLFQLTRHAEVTAFHCHDALESRLPRAGRYAVSDGARRSELDTAERGLRERFRSAREEEHAALRQRLGRLGIPLLPAATDQSPLRLLQIYYGDPRR